MHKSYAITHIFLHIAPATFQYLTPPLFPTCQCESAFIWPRPPMGPQYAPTDAHHQCELTNHIAVLVCQGCDSSDFHKGSGMLILRVCVCEIWKWPRARLATKKTPNMCTRAVVARGHSFTHASRYLGMQKRRHFPALSVQERALESAREGWLAPPCLHPLILPVLHQNLLTLAQSCDS